MLQQKILIVFLWTVLIQSKFGYVFLPTLILQIGMLLLLTDFIFFEPIKIEILLKTFQKFLFYVTIFGMLQIVLFLRIWFWIPLKFVTQLPLLLSSSGMLVLPSTLQSRLQGINKSDGFHRTRIISNLTLIALSFITNNRLLALFLVTFKAIQFLLLLNTLVMLQLLLQKSWL